MYTTKCAFHIYWWRDWFIEKKIKAWLSLFSFSILSPREFSIPLLHKQSYTPLAPSSKKKELTKKKEKQRESTWIWIFRTWKSVRNCWTFWTVKSRSAPIFFSKQKVRKKQWHKKKEGKRKRHNKKKKLYYRKKPTTQTKATN